jgi:branched-subunit amino acid ABC-type transport system permease component
MTPPKPTRRTIFLLTLSGGAAFWLANFCISLTPFAAGYRAALHITYVPMLIEALAGGLIIGFIVSWFLIRFFDRFPARSPILKSLLISSIVLLFVTLVFEVPAKFFTPIPDPVHWFLAGLLINVIRLLALGLAAGYVYGKLDQKRPGNPLL